MSAFAAPYGRVFDFSGRSSRSEFWGFVAFVTAVSLVIALLAPRLGVDARTAVPTWSAFNLLPALSAQVRRLHDTGRSGWWSLLALVPLVGQLVLLVWLCQHGRQPADVAPPTTAAEGRLVELERLADLKSRGALSESEFADEKRRVLERAAVPVRRPEYRSNPGLAILGLAVSAALAAGTFVLSGELTDEAGSFIPTPPSSARSENVATASAGAAAPVPRPASFGELGRPGPVEIDFAALGAAPTAIASLGLDLNMKLGWFRQVCRDPAGEDGIVNHDEMLEIWNAERAIYYEITQHDAGVLTEADGRCLAEAEESLRDERCEEVADAEARAGTIAENQVRRLVPQFDPSKCAKTKASD